MGVMYTGDPHILGLYGMPGVEHRIYVFNRVPGIWGSCMVIYEPWLLSPIWDALVEQMEERCGVVDETEQNSRVLLAS